MDRGTIRPLAYPAVQNIERDGTRVQDMIVELPYVEAVSELFVRELRDSCSLSSPILYASA